MITRAGPRALLASCLAACATASAAAGPAAATVEESLVFGSFRNPANAGRWAEDLEVRFSRTFTVEPVNHDDGVWYRVRTPALAAQARGALQQQAAAAGLPTWVIRDEPTDTLTSSADAPEVADAGAAAPATAAADSRPDGVGAGTSAGRLESTAPALPRRLASGSGAARDADAFTVRRTPPATVRADFDLGVQTRTYAHEGLAGQSRFQPSTSARLEYYRAWDQDRSSVTFTPFVRIDSRDDERTHADLRELYLSRVGTDWEVHVGARQVFWGVTEFHHLVDIVNQTDLVENIDGEDKLGQPMIQVSLVRDWGVVDVYALTGFRERTFPGEDGRLRSPLPVDGDRARYVSGAGRSRVDGAVRYSHHLGPLSFGVHHFSGTGRDPQFVAEVADGEAVLVPVYHVIDQTGLDAQALFGDWAWKLEALTRSGHGERYEAFTAGFERTLVGAFGTRSDLGVVVEYLYDERDDAAFDTLFEHDLALGARWRRNDMANTQALAGVIWDVETDEYLLSLEASRQLGTSWQAVLEARVFGGAGGLDAAAVGEALRNGERKSVALQEDDFVQLELTRYF